MSPDTAYFIKKYYPHVIKWWLVTYNPEVIRIWPSKAEEEDALRLEAEEAETLALEQNEDDGDDEIDSSAFNATTGSYSGLYGQKPVDEDTQAALDAIMNISSSQNSIDYLLSGGQPVTGAAYAIGGQQDIKPTGDIVLPPDQEDVLNEANAIYERLLREAAEDEARKQAEIDEARRQVEAGETGQF